MWTGSISVDQGAISQPRPLGIEADEPGSMWLDGGRLLIRERSPRAYDGADMSVTAPRDAKIIVQLTAAGDARPGAPIEIPLSEISGQFRDFELDKEDTRLLVRRTPGDPLLFRTSHPSMVFSPGETMRFEIVPHELPLPSDVRLRIKAQLLDAQQRELWSSYQDIRGDSTEPVSMSLALPKTEAVYDIVLTAQQKPGWPRVLRNSLQWRRPMVERRVQIIVISPQRPAASNGHDLSPVLEIDPTNSKWWEKVKWAHLPQFHRGLAGPLGNGMRETIHHPLGDVSQLKPSAASPDLSWEAYPLSIGQPGRPYVLEVEYPSDVPQTLGISILEVNAAGTLTPIGLDSGIDVSDEAARSAAPHWERHRLVFWPRTGSPLALIVNRRQKSPAVYGKIRVLGGWDQLPGAAASPAGPPPRLLAAYMDRPLLVENFSAEEVLDAWSGRPLQDWRTFHQAGNRLVEYLRYAGYNGLVLTVAADGSAIYPSRVLQPTPRYDTGVFFADGQDPMPKDVLEMLLRLMDRENLQLIPSLEFAAPLPSLEAMRRRGGAEAQGLEWIGADGKTWCETEAPRRGLAPYYNTLDPRVQEAMLAAVRELVGRYASHASFRGLALRLSAYGYAQLPGSEWGMDDATIARFERDTATRVPGSGEKRFAVRAAFLNSSGQRVRWLQWRAAQCHKFYHRIQSILAAARPGMPLYLAGADMLTGPEIASELRPGLLRRSSLSMALLQAGIDPRLYHNDAKVVLLRPRRIQPAAPLNAQAVDLEMAQMPEAAAFFREMPQPGSLFFHPPLEATLPSFDQKLAIKGSSVLLLSQIVPSGMQDRRRFAESLASQDSRILMDGGWMLPMGQEDATHWFAAGFRKLPAIPFADVEGSRAGLPVVFRWAASRGKTYAYCVNTTPFSINAKVHVTASLNCPIDDLSGGGRPGQLKNDGDGVCWNVALEPYDLAAVCFAEPDARLFQPSASLPKSAAELIAARIRRLSARAVDLRTPPLMKVLENANFQSTPSAAEPVPGWAISKRPGVSIVTDTTQGHAADPASVKGAQSARITSDGSPACLVSRPFAPPGSGRITISVWLRVADAAHQPRLQLAVEGKLNGRDYYRFAVIGQPAPGQSASPIAAVWRQFIVPFDDLPLEGLSQMRVRLDLMGKGQVWADDVQLFDLAFNESELRALYKMLTLADAALQNGEPSESLKLLSGYWPKFLEENVPPPSAPAVVAKPASEAPAAAEPPASDKPSAPPQPSSWLDRVRRIMPESLR